MTETIIAPGIVRYDYAGWKQSYEGTKDALIAAGIAKESWFVAGERDKRGHTFRSKKLEIDGRRIVTRVPKIGPASVAFYCTEAELQAERERERAAEEKELLRAVDEKEAIELGWIPNSHKRFRELMLTETRIWIDRADRLKKGLGGYRYTPETIEEFQEAIAGALEILAEGKSSFNPQRHAEKIADIKARGAKADPSLQRFLQAIGNEGTTKKYV